ncbi:MAG: Ser-Thr-rich GPI-anchored membrane family protein, partial [Promethearchaeota archaeon]
WTSTGTISNVKIELYNNNIFEMEIIPSKVNDGAYYWTVPSSLADSDQYQIKITDAADPATYDFSDYFEILTIPDTITITTPSSSTSWETNSSHYIYWTSTGTISNVKIELYNNNVYVSDIILNTANDGEYYWTLPNVADSTLYQVKISDISNPSTFDFSDYFEIFTIPDTITITTPSSSTSWEKGTSHYISWTSTGTISNVKIELYRNNIYVSEITPSTANDGQYYWTLPDVADSTLYQVKITDTSNSGTFDFSDYFEIKTPSSGGPGGIPGYNFYLIIAVLGILSIALAKRRIRRV